MSEETTRLLGETPGWGAETTTPLAHFTAPDEETTAPSDEATSTTESLDWTER